MKTINRTKKTKKLVLRNRSDTKTVKPIAKSAEEKPKSTLPKGEYAEEFKPEELQISDSMKCVFSVIRKGEYGLPYCDIRMWANTEKYKGPTRQGLSFPIIKLAEFINRVNDLYDDCEERGLFEEFEDE